MACPKPTPESQLDFLSKLQRLFAEGDFTATYKFALLIVLAELAVEYGNDDGSELQVTLRQIGRRFIQLYWNQAAPYSSGRTDTSAGVLVQNTGRQAAVLAAIEAFRAASGVQTSVRAELHAGYGRLLTEVCATVSAQPLKYLQNFGGVTDEFLYCREPRGVVRLHPGIAFCLRRFYPLVQQLARTHWIEHIKANRQNQVILGGASDLEDFLFAASRTSLSTVREQLLKLDGHACFYCGQRMQDMDVDHYVPFALYPRDLIQNFVLAHPSCNRSKSSALAAKQHLERWLTRLVMKRDQLDQIGDEVGFVTDANAIRQVAQWSYQNAHQASGNAWLTAARFEPVSADYLALFSG
jgi:5-methylcytosine-specific restriction endonuclease McrA